MLHSTPAAICADKTQQAAPTTSSVQTLLGSASLADTRAVLVKFTFTNQNRIPAGIKRKFRNTDYNVDVMHADSAKRAGQDELAQFGRVREHRVDTGQQVIVLPSAQIAVLRAGLRLQGFALTSAHWEERKRPGRKSQFIVVCTFARGTAADLSDETKDALQSLATAASWTTYVWANPDGTITVNCNSRQENVAPKHALIVRGKAIIAREVAANLTETQEAE